MAKRPQPNRAETRAHSIRCAIYTRKSTEEGLEQEFNSLDAQREACAAYILSQRHEGWTLVKDSYDDGGFSGGNMARPGLKRLLADVEAGKVDVIVVYKVDRLTRALSDFAKIVDILDARGASFVSITQSFNTTTSMGRLTLNVLLSFAQFEREVTGERICDKIAASTKKGMWMGGNVPLGYDVCERKLVENPAEAVVVRHVMQRYVALGSGRALLEELHRTGYRTKRIEREGKPPRGGVPFTRGMLFHILSNRIYVGDIVHQGVAYPGEHDAIVSAELWEAVQQRIAENRVQRHRGTNIREHSLLAGIIRDGEGRRMSPSHAVKGARRYRYYITHEAERQEGDAAAWRVSAHDVETVVVARLRQLLGDRSALMAMIADAAAGEGAASGAAGGSTAANDSAAAAARALVLAVQSAARLDDPQQRRLLLQDIVIGVDLAQDHIALTINQIKLLALLGIDESTKAPDTLTLIVRTAKIRTGKDVRLIVAADAGSGDARVSRDDALVMLLAEAQQAYDAVLATPEQTITQIARASRRCRTRYAQLVRIAMLAPDIIRHCIAGTQPPTLTAHMLLTAPLPIAWADQRALLGIG